MGEPGRGGGLASTVGAIIGALAVLATVVAFAGYTGGLTQKVEMTELTPAQRAAAERTVIPASVHPPPPAHG